MPSVVPPYASVGSRANDRVEILHPHYPFLFHPPTSMFSNLRRFSGSRGVPPVTQPPSSSSDHGDNFYALRSSGSSGRNVQETANPPHRHFYAWERDLLAPFPLIPLDRELSWWPPHQSVVSSDSGSTGNSDWHGHGSERTSSESCPPHPPPS